MQMTMAVKTRKNRKFNWEPVERDMDKGLSTKELSEKFSIPTDRIRSRRRERRLRLAESALLHANDGVGASGLPAPLPRPRATEAQKPLEISNSPAELTEEQLVALLADPQAVLALTADQLEKLAGRRVQLLYAQAMVNPPEARTLKDVATLHKIFRESNGLTGDKGKGGNGLLSPPRSFSRRQVLDAVEVPVSRVPQASGGRVPERVIEEPEGGWPEGM